MKQHVYYVKLLQNTLHSYIILSANKQLCVFYHADNIYYINNFKCQIRLNISNDLLTKAHSDVEIEYIKLKLTPDRKDEIWNIPLFIRDKKYIS